ncbi:MAG: adenylate cyclase [Flammeovirgaceae bacterium]|jgi:adenylate cyclase
MTPNQKRDFAKILQFGILWVIGGVLYSLLEYGILGNSETYPSTNNLYEFETSLLSAVTISLLIGFLIGGIETKIVNAYFETRNFWQKIVFKTTLYLTLIILLLLISSFILNSSRLDVPMFHPKTVQSILQFVCNFSFWSIMIFAGITTMLTLFISEVSDYLGGGVFNNFFTGKYHHPREEERIFMFLDMNSSTTIAEKLGHKEYFLLLRKYYADLTQSIVQTGGEVYQYAGDEIIVSWNLKKGLTDNNCIECFFSIKKMFQISSDEYIKRFGLVPKFKAGFHYGKVTTGEIGVLKKELFFTGDVLNTTARIQTTCSQYKTDILLSEELIALLEITDTYEILPIGECQLKGRHEKISLSTIRKATHNPN